MGLMNKARKSAWNPHKAFIQVEDHGAVVVKYSGQHLSVFVSLHYNGVCAGCASSFRTSYVNC